MPIAMLASSPAPRPGNSGTAPPAGLPWLGLRLRMADVQSYSAGRWGFAVPTWANLLAQPWPLPFQCAQEAPSPHTQPPGRATSLGYHKAPWAKAPTLGPLEELQLVQRSCKLVITVRPPFEKGIT